MQWVSDDPEGAGGVCRSEVAAFEMVCGERECRAGCYADCDTSTGVGVLDIFDFRCFQSAFVAGDPYACDRSTSTGPGVCDIFDFLRFQDAFVAGCP